MNPLPVSYRKICCVMHQLSNRKDNQKHLLIVISRFSFKNQFLTNGTIVILNVWCVCVYIGFKTFFYVVRHLDSIASYLPTGLPLGFFRAWPSSSLPSSFSSVFLVLSFVLASTSMLFWAIFLLPFVEHGRTTWAGSWLHFQIAENPILKFSDS